MIDPTFFAVSAIFDVVAGVRRFRDFPLADSDSANEGCGEGRGRLGGGEGPADWDGVAVAVPFWLGAVEGAVEDPGVAD